MALTTPKLTAEIEQTLKEYKQLQSEEQRLKERKQGLQDKLKEHMREYAAERDKSTWFPVVDGQRLKVSFRCVAQVDYDEEELRRRLQDRYSSLLAPDLSKLRAQLPELEEELHPLLDRIGSPAVEKVKAAINAGIATVDEFKGAFTKRTKEYISVAGFREDG